MAQDVYAALRVSISPGVWPVWPEYRVGLAVQQIRRDASGLAPAYPPPATTQLSIPNNDGRMFLDVRNAGDEQTVTVQTPLQMEGLDVSEYVATIPATDGVRVIGPFPPALFNQSDGSVYIDLSASTTMTVVCFRLQ